MKQLNVRDETHQLCRELSVRTGRSLLVLVHEALERYAAQLEGHEVEDMLIQKAVVVIDERMCKIVHEEVPHAIDEVLRLQTEEFERQKRELEKMLLSQPQEEFAEGEVDETDDLKVVSYEEIYGKGNGNDASDKN